MNTPSSTARTRGFGSALLLTLLLSLPARAQQSTPRIGYIYPAGGKQGTEFQIAVGGKQLDGVSSASVSGAGVRAFVVEHVEPMSPQQQAALRTQLRMLEEKRAAAAGMPLPGGIEPPAQRPAWTFGDDKRYEELRRKLAYQQRRPASPAIAETVILAVHVAPDAPAGERELRLRTPAGLSAPMVFSVGQVPETSEADLQASDTRTVMTVKLPAIINGQIMPGDVDRYRFKGRRGQHVVITAAARALVPYIADAVPGWFQATLALYDGNGRELAYADDYRFHPDPVLYCRLPADGDYLLEVRDALYRGREDFVYRLSVGETPFVTGIFPLGTRADTRTTLAVTGWNLLTPRLAPEALPPGIHLIASGNEDLVSNRVPFAVDTLPEAMEKESNNRPGRAQAVTLPLTMNGRIDYPGDWDVFRIDDVKAGEELVAEVLARRLNSPLDSVLRLTDAAGKQIAFDDDFEDRGAGLTTHHADSRLRAQLPAAGTYYLHLGDTQRRGGAEYAYRLRISAPRPDYELRVTPSCINVRGGGIVPITVHALRKDGFSGDITLSLTGAKGLALAGATLPAGQDEVRLTLAAAQVPREPLPITIEGRADIAGRETVRTAVAADDLMQAFAYRHLVTAAELKIVSGSAFAAAPLKVESSRIKIPTGGTARIPVSGSVTGKVRFDLNDPPDGLFIPESGGEGQGGQAGPELLLKTDPAKIKPGLKGNLIVTATAEIAAPTDANPNAIRRTPLGLLPAIPFEVVAPPQDE